MPQSIFRPTRKPGYLTQALDFASRGNRHNVAHHSSVRAKPRCKIRLYRNYAASRALSSCCFDFDMAARINFTPIQALYLGITKPGKCTNGEHWKNVGRLPL